MKKLLLLLGLLLAPPIPSAELWSDGFESGDLTATAGGYAWGSSLGDSGNAPVVSTDIARTGTYSLKFTYKGTATGSDAWSEQRFVLGADQTDLYVRWYNYFPNGTETAVCNGGSCNDWLHRDEAGDENNKWFRIWEDVFSPYSVKVGMNTEGGANPDSKMRIKKGTLQSSVAFWAAPSPDNSVVNDALKGRWVYVEVHFAVDSGVGDAVGEVWIDDPDTALISKTDGDNYPDDGLNNHFRNGFLMGWANSGFTLKSYTYIDDVVWADSRIGVDGLSTINMTGTIVGMTGPIDGDELTVGDKLCASTATVVTGTVAEYVNAGGSGLDRANHRGAISDISLIFDEAAGDCAASTFTYTWDVGQFVLNNYDSSATKMGIIALGGDVTDNTPLLNGAAPEYIGINLGHFGTGKSHTAIPDALPTCCTTGQDIIIFYNGTTDKMTVRLDTTS